MIDQGSDSTPPAKPAVNVRVARAFSAPAEQVFDAWLQPDVIGRWMFGPNVRDEEIIHLKLDSQIGGTFSFLVRRGGNEIDHVGIYRVIDRPRQLAFTWGVAAQSADESVVTIDIAAMPPGCELTLTHAMDPKWAEFAGRVESGWKTMLDKLSDIMN